MRLFALLACTCLVASSVGCGGDAHVDRRPWHPGAIYLLHGVSSSDTDALDAAIAGLRKQGYGFGTL